MCKKSAQTGIFSKKNCLQMVAFLCLFFSCKKKETTFCFILFVTLGIFCTFEDDGDQNLEYFKQTKFFMEQTGPFYTS